MVTESSPVLCTGCAFLAERDDRGEIVEALPAYRQHPSNDRSRNQRSGPAPVCFMGKRSFTAEYNVVYTRLTKERTGHNDNAHLALTEVLAVEPTCGIWTQYVEGITPREHREMLDRQWRIDMERKWRRQDRRDRRKELSIAGETARVTRWAAWIQAGSVAVAVIAIAVSAWVGLQQNNRPNVTNNTYSNLPVTPTAGTLP